MRQNKHKSKTKAFRKVNTVPTISEHFNTLLEQHNNYCLQHCNEDLTFMEYEMEKALFSWFTALIHSNTYTFEEVQMYEKWAEIVSRWNPLFMDSGDHLRMRLATDLVLHDNYLRHCDDLPDELD